MNKRNLSIVVIVFLAVIIVFSAKIITGKGIEEKKGQRSINLEEQYKKILSSNKPSIIVFSYDADCCENTKKFFNEYNTKVNALLKAYEDKFEILFINTGTIKDEKQNNLLVKIADENEVSTLPSILILNSKNKKVAVIEGVFDEEEVRKVLDGVVTQ